MTPEETDELLTRAAKNDSSAVGRLLAGHRSRLRQMVSVRMDDRVRQRVDPSDVVQEALLEAALRLPEYVKQKPVPFYPWLREMAVNRLIDIQRRHVVARKRSVDREESRRALPDQSVMQLARRLIGSGTSPSLHAHRREQREHVKAALDELDPKLREVLVLKYLEELSSGEVSVILKVNQRTVRRWHRRAIEQIRSILKT